MVLLRTMSAVLFTFFSASWRVTFARGSIFEFLLRAWLSCHVCLFVVHMLIKKPYCEIPGWRIHELQCTKLYSKETLPWSRRCQSLRLSKCFVDCESHWSRHFEFVESRFAQRVSPNSYHSASFQGANCGICSVNQPDANIFFREATGSEHHRQTGLLSLILCDHVWYCPIAFFVRVVRKVSIQCTKWVVWFAVQNK